MAKFNELKQDQFISGGQGEAYVDIDGQRYSLGSVKELEATIEKEKSDIAVLGRTGKIHKTTSWNGSGSMTLYYNQSLFRRLTLEYVKTGKDFYFDIVVTNEDAGSSLGRETKILRNCNTDSVMFAKIATEDEVLEEDMDFTFDDVDMPETFNDDVLF